MRPGVSEKPMVDPKWSNLPAVLGVGLAFLLSLWASRAGRREFSRTSARGDATRLLVGGLSFFFAAPYIAAELGFFLDGVPVLGSIFLTGAIRPEPGAGYSHAAVHHGHHHGMDGFLLAVSALLLSRLVGSIRRMANGAVAFYVAGGRGGFRRTLRKSYFCFRTPWSNVDDFRF